MIAQVRTAGFPAQAERQEAGKSWDRALTLYKKPVSKNGRLCSAIFTRMILSS